MPAVTSKGTGTHVNIWYEQDVRLTKALQRDVERRIRRFCRSGDMKMGKEEADYPNELKDSSRGQTDMEKTIAYYDKNAAAFIGSTINADVTELYKPFIELVPPGARILDLGCGSGRDSRYFAQHGYDVLAMDPSPAMCEHTRSIVDIPVFQMKAEEMRFHNEFDAVWACASLLHVPRDRQKKVIMLIGRALKPKGICYCSWKYGDEEREDNGRHFTDYTERSLSDLLGSVDIFEVVNCWITDDVRNGIDQKWINVIMKKISCG